MAKYSLLCVDFDGTSYGSAGNVLDKIHTDAFSIVGWVKGADLTADILSKMDGGAVGYSMGIVSGALDFIRADAGGSDQVRASTDTHFTNVENWLFYAVTCAGGLGAATMLLYINGVAAAQSTISNTLTGSMTNAGVLTCAGRNAVANYGAAEVGNGCIDGLAMYDAVLTPAEILALYNLREPSDYSLISTTANIDSHWRMGDDAGDSNVTIVDVVGVNDFTLTGVVAADLLEYQTCGGWSVGGENGVRGLGASAATVFYDMHAIDPACAPGTAPTTWTVQGAPDLAAASAPAFPCGAGPYSPVWIGRKYSVE